MSIAIAVWSTVLKPGDTVEVTPPTDLRITNIALGEEVADANSRTSVRMIYRPPMAEEDEDEEDKDDSGALATTILASLTPGKIEQASVDIIIEGDSDYLFEVVGKNTVYITGNYIEQPIPQDNDLTPDGSEIDSDEEGLDLDEVSSDVAYEAHDLELEDEDDEDAARFEEIHEENVKGAQAKAQKRSAESMEVDATEPKLSKAEKKKKRKGDDGKPVAVEAAEVKAAEPAVEKSDKKKEKKVGKKADGPTGKITELPGGLKIQDATTGEGKMAKKGSTVSMRYIGKLTNGQVFDKNTKGKPFTFHLGAGEVIKGWDQGIVGMQPGGERTLTVPAPLAYGKRSMPGIPSNSTLIFEVKCLEVK